MEEAVAGDAAVEAGGGLGSRTAAPSGGTVAQTAEREISSLFFGGSPYFFLFLVILGGLSFLFSVCSFSSLSLVNSFSLLLSSAYFFFLLPLRSSLFIEKKKTEQVC